MHRNNHQSTIELPAANHFMLITQQRYDQLNDLLLALRNYNNQSVILERLTQTSLIIELINRLLDHVATVTVTSIVPNKPTERIMHYHIKWDHMINLFCSAMAIMAEIDRDLSLKKPASDRLWLRLSNQFQVIFNGIDQDIISSNMSLAETTMLSTQGALSPSSDTHRSSGAQLFQASYVDISSIITEPVTGDTDLVIAEEVTHSYPRATTTHPSIN